MEQVVRFLFKYKASLFSKSEFTFGAWPGYVVIALVGAGMALLVVFLYSRGSLRLPLRWRAALMALRCLLLALLFICLMRPVIVAPSVVPGSSYVAVLLDDSSSMLIADEDGRSRIDAAKQLFNADGPLGRELTNKFKVRLYKFSSRAERVQDASELTGSGDRSDIASAVDQAMLDMTGLPLAGLIVVSDGANNFAAGAPAGIAGAMAALRDRRTPVFAVGAGKGVLRGDVALVRVTAPRRVLAGSPVSVELLIRTADDSIRSVKVDLSEDGRALRSQDVPLQSGATTAARITFTPSAPGLRKYSLTVPPGRDEPVTENNSVQFVVDVEDVQRRILYFEGEPRWEYGKLREALAEEKNVVVVSVLRSADGKFYRQGIGNPDELVNGFPKSEEELFKYDGIILGSAEATFFTFDQLRAIEQFVYRRGGTLLVLGGARSFSAGGYAGTPISDVLPVTLSSQNSTPGEIEGFLAGPAERGREHPASRLMDQPETNAKAWDQMPAITLPEVITVLKPGATLILEARSVKDKSRTVPLLAEQRYGRGKSLAFMASDTWRWRMMLESKNKSFETFWKSLLRYQVESVRQKLEAAAERDTYAKGDGARLRAEFADDKFINVANARVTARVTSPSGATSDVAFKALLDGDFEGYAADVPAEEEGLYRVDVSATRPAAEGRAGLTGSSRTSIVVQNVDREALDPAQNVELMKRLAAETGGSYYPISAAAGLVDDLTHVEGEGSVRTAYDLWDMPINFLLAIALVAGEWFIRKRKGLA